MADGIKTSVWIKGMISLFIVFSCTVTFKVRNQQLSLIATYALPCCTISSELEGRGNSKFVFRQKIVADAPIILYMDSVRILFNNKMTQPAGKSPEKKEQDVVKLKQGTHTVEWPFNLPEGVFDGDTIRVIQHAAVGWNNERFSLPDLIYTFRNPVVIHGVNVPQ